MTDLPHPHPHPPSPAAVTLAVVRQDQMGAFAVVTGTGQALACCRGRNWRANPGWRTANWWR